MNLKCAGTRPFRTISVCCSATLLLAMPLFSRVASAQTSNDETKPAETKPDQLPYQTFFLTYATDRNSLNDIQTDLRNMMPRAKIFGVEMDKAITVRGTADDLATAQKLIADLDKPRKVYRLTYTVTDKDNPSKDEQHYSLIVASGDRTVFKQGDRVPIITGTSGDKPAPPSSEVQCVDVGVNINADLATSADALMLSTKFELSSVGNPMAGLNNTGDPDIRQTVLQETTSLMPDKPLVLGTLDLPGTTRHQEIQVVAELVH
jgi:type II secretory pathway component GspD/PulD (secretin)